MGQKVNPIGLRLKSFYRWEGVGSNWFAGKDYGKFLHEDFRIKDYVLKRIKEAGVSKVLIERISSKKMNINIHVARPGVVVSKKRNELDHLKKKLAEFTDSEIRINVIEVKRPELDAKLTADNIAAQLERRVSFRRAMKRAVQSCLKAGGKGIRVSCSGRLGGAEIARTEWYIEGRVPLHTLRSNIDYAESTGFTTYGACGIKVWIYKGDNLSVAHQAKEKKSSTKNKNNK